MIKYILVCFGFVAAIPGITQNTQTIRTTHWYFGNEAGLDFTTGSPSAVTDGQQIAWGGTTVMSDLNGNLLMYSEGQNVWNKNHQIMPNGTGLLADGTPIQSSLIVPLPLSDSIYYIFTCQALFDGTGNYGIRYSIVDMSLDGGLGDVTIKNELLFAPSSEQLNATMHANCLDVWIMGHEYGTNKYRAYLLTEYGIDTNDVVINEISNFAKEDTVASVCWNCSGFGLKFSPDGKKMAASNFWDNLNNPSYLDTLDLYDFDNQTGLLSNLIQLPDTTVGGFGFSPDGSKLYVYNYNTISGNAGIWPYYADVFQYDISSANIIASKILLTNPQFSDFSDFQIGPDLKIYIAHPLNDSIGIITSPNEIGSLCGIIESEISLNGKFSGVMLPNFVSSYFSLDSISGCFYSIGLTETPSSPALSIYPNPSTAQVTIEFNSEINIVEVWLTDILGNTVHICSLQELDYFAKQISLDISNLKAGVYLLNIKSCSDKIFTEKINVIK